MKTTHTITIYHQLPNESELELRAKVSLANGRHGFEPDDFDIEWLAESANFVAGVSREQEKAFEQIAREAWFDRMADEPSERDEADEAGDRAYDEQRDWQMLAGAE